MTDRDADDLDRLGLLRARDRTDLRVGDTDVRPLLRTATLHEAMSELPRAHIELRESLVRGSLVDYLAPVTFSVPGSRREGPRFVGDVTVAAPQGDRISVDVASMPELTETEVGLFATWNVPTIEHIHAVARAVGLPDENINIEGLDTLPAEVFEVVVPVEGVVVDGRTELGEIWLDRPESVARALDGPGADAAFTDPFTRADCVATAHVVANLMFHAEEDATAMVDAALGWLSVALRYGMSHWPDGTAHRFDRAEFRAVPRRQEVAWVRGLVNGRHWIRGTGRVAVNPTFALQARHVDLKSPQTFSLQDDQAVQALRRAAATDDPVQAVTAVWDAIEFYVAGTAGPRSFDEDTLKALRKTVPKDLPPPLRGRVIDAIDRLNQAPLLTRLRVAMTEDGVPSADDEWKLLQRLRRSRNAIVHGAGGEAAADARDLARAQAFVARLLIYRAHRLAGSD